MKFKNLPLIILLILFVILSIFYIMYVCNYNSNELFDTYISDPTGVKITNINGYTKNCFLDIDEFNKCTKIDRDNSKGICDYTDKFILRGNPPIEYHNDYTCDNVKSNYINSFKDIDEKNLLLTYKCIKVNPRQLRDWCISNKIVNQDQIIFFADMYNNMYPIGNSDEPNLIHAIRDKITNYIKDSNSYESKFPIYACISQAPYIKDGNDKTIVWDHNRGQPISHYKYSCSLGINDNETDLCEQTHKMYIEVTLIFFKNIRTDIENFIKYVDDNISNSLQCDMNCGNGNRQIGLTCGCLNKNQSYGNYNSICNTGNDVTDYSIIYYVNPFYEFNYNINKELNFKTS